ncbi:uncharacterized protein LTR77_004015 [Saxophila tyrrhenica]|uniref:Uncharacterized protein n=1 Tax=Saxophila tyrrhenica TaxID=1690608 RepID=A0AAV9PIA2_9PEZI|nr:hypothetical protein LTR77_004015 [Saxophila tyrrhenica]
MGLQKTDLERWIEIDKSYLQKYQIKKSLIHTHRDEVTCASPECKGPAHEALLLLVDVLTQRYPSMFVKPNGHSIKNLVTGDMWDLKPSSTNWEKYHPLEVMGLLATDDFFILENDPTTGVTALKGGCVCFPGKRICEPHLYLSDSADNQLTAGWKIEERVGLSLWQIHAGKVPHYEQALSKSMDRFFLRMKSGNLTSRFNYAIDDSDDLFRRHSHHNLSNEHDAPLLKLEDLHLRVERQVLQRLPESGALLFSIRTYVTPITEVTKDRAVAEALRTSTRSYDEKLSAYKNQPLWNDALQKHLSEVLGDDDLRQDSAVAEAAE